MAAWRLNTFLTTFRAYVNKKYASRSKLSDGTIGDLTHSQTKSEHNMDADGSVDAWDLDVNLLGSSTPTGTSTEIIEMTKVLAEFQRQPQAQLWIFRRQIANRDIDDWRVRPYSGPSPHDHHAHLQSRSSMETRPYVPGVDLVVPAVNSKPTAVGSRTLKRGMKGADVAYLQRWLGVEPDDGVFGPALEAEVKRYQRDRNLVADGIAGPATFKVMGFRR